jgi:hypothetical protein
MGNGAAVANSRLYNQESEDICGFLWSYGSNVRSEPTQCWVTACAETNQLQLDEQHEQMQLCSRDSLSLNGVIDVQAVYDPDTPFQMHISYDNGSSICLQADNEHEWQRWLFKLPRIALSSHLAHNQEQQIAACPQQLLADVLITVCAMDRANEAALILAEVSGSNCPSSDLHCTPPT